MKDYFIGGGDPFGDNCPNEIFNKEFVPRLIELGISEKDMDDVVKMFVEIYDFGYDNGVANEAFNLSENS